MTSTKPCGSQQCSDWIRANGYEPYDYPDSVCWGCGFSGPMYAWLSQTPTKKRNDEQSSQDGVGKDANDG